MQSKNSKWAHGVVKKNAKLNSLDSIDFTANITLNCICVWTLLRCLVSVEVMTAKLKQQCNSSRLLSAWLSDIRPRTSAPLDNVPPDNRTTGQKPPGQRPQTFAPHSSMRYILRSNYVIIWVMHFVGLPVLHKLLVIACICRTSFLAFRYRIDKCYMEGRSVLSHTHKWTDGNESRS